jgi:hypothetical protein
LPISLEIDVAAIVTAFVWPIFIGIVISLIVRYRKNIGSFLKDLRVSKISFGTFFSFELFEAKKFEPNWVGSSPLDLRQSAIDGIKTSAPDLVTQIQENSVADYAIFDLGDGNKWLNTRLYLFAVILQRMRRLRNIVFVDKHQEISHQFVGIAKPSEVYYSLARRYPWLERAFARAYEALSDVRVTTVYGSIDQLNAVELVEKFLEDKEIQSCVEPIDSFDDIYSDDPKVGADLLGLAIDLVKVVTNDPNESGRVRIIWPHPGTRVVRGSSVTVEWWGLPHELPPPPPTF